MKDRWKMFENGRTQNSLDVRTESIKKLDEERERERKELQKQRQARWKEREERLKREAEEQRKLEEEKAERKRIAEQKRREQREAQQLKQVRIVTLIFPRDTHQVFNETQCNNVLLTYPHIRNICEFMLMYVKFMLIYA